MAQGTTNKPIPKTTFERGTTILVKMGLLKKATKGRNGTQSYKVMGKLVEEGNSVFAIIPAKTKRKVDQKTEEETSNTPSTQSNIKHNVSRIKQRKYSRKIISNIVLPEITPENRERIRAVLYFHQRKNTKNLEEARKIGVFEDREHLTYFAERAVMDILMGIESQIPEQYREVTAEKTVIPSLIKRTRARTHARARSVLVEVVSSRWNRIVFFFVKKENTKNVPKLGHFMKCSFFNLNSNKNSNIQEESIRLEEQETDNLVLDFEEMFSNKNSKPVPIFDKHSGMKFWDRDDVPTYPSRNVMAIPHIPYPQLIDPEWSDDQLYRTLTQMWYKCFFTKYKKKSGELSAGRSMSIPLTNRYFKIVLKTARQLQEYQYAPVSWIMFSFMVWDEFFAPKMKKRKTPVAKWVFDPKRLDNKNNRRRFEILLPQISTGGTVVPCPAHREMSLRIRFMRDALSRLPPIASDRDVDDVVSVFFPDDTYRRLIKEGNEQTQETQAKLQQLVESGDWIWGDV
jgi:CRISPR/Cas system CSM-associated protein Csm2 small subunit